MGATPNAQNLFNGYVNKIPILPKGVENGEDVAQYYDTKYQFTEISLFTKKRFVEKFKTLGCSGVEKEKLWYFANKLNAKMQKQFNAQKNKGNEGGSATVAIGTQKQ